MNRVSVTELQTWLECQLKWEYKHRERLRHIKPSQPMLTGQAVHFGVEAGLALGKAQAVESALVYLRKSGQEEKSGKQVVKALEGIPEWVWEIPLPQSETKLEVQFEKVVVVGKPDLWYVDGDGIKVVEFKSSGSKELERLERYERWNTQPLWYLALLKASLNHDLPCYSQHILLSTRGKHVVGRERFVSDEAVRRAGHQMVAISERVGVDEILPHESGSCDFCEFHEICEMRLTGGDFRSKIEQEFKSGRKGG